ncbi:MAG: family 43 glycosylhydrolase [Clostridia bacterium]|nr:family 43 glycosylhydrolase [Clostridia bacterium]
MQTDTSKYRSTVITSSIPQLRDPCVLVENGIYYAYGTGWTCWKNTSGSLTGTWTNLGCVVSVPEHSKGCHWAPEVHKYNGAYYMFTTYQSSQTNRRGCTILKSDRPEGPFTEISGGHLTPAGWDSIDGTFYVDPSGQPWMIFVHEWVSMPDRVGTMAAAKLSGDLTHFITEPIELFRADAAPWAAFGVTDGCWMYRTAGGQLLMLWSNCDNAGYCVGIARSRNGSVEGPWEQDEQLLFSKNLTGEYDGGHAMIFTDTDGQMYLSLHSPNNPSQGRPETPVFVPVREENNTLIWDF